MLTKKSPQHDEKVCFEISSKQVRAGEASGITALVSDTVHISINDKIDTRCYCTQRQKTACLRVRHACLQVGVSARSRSPPSSPLPLRALLQSAWRERVRTEAKHLQECRGRGRETAYLAASRRSFTPS